LPDKRIPNLGLSFKDIGKRCNKISKKYLLNNLKNGTPNEIMNNQKTLRRALSNVVNDPENLVNHKGQYIGERYGLRITVITSGGLVIHDVETFCRDVRNLNKRILGNSNNFVYIKNNTFSQGGQDQTPLETSPAAAGQILFSTLNVNDVINSTIQYTNLNAYKVKSSSVPSSDPNSKVMRYLPNETNDGYINISSGELIDLHTSRIECIQAVAGRYGYASRSKTTTNSYYVCKHVQDDYGKSLLFRISFFEYPPQTSIDVLAESGEYELFIRALKATDLLTFVLEKQRLAMFAPSNKAFMEVTGLSEDEIEQIHEDPENKEQLRTLLMYHMAAWTDDLPALDVWANELPDSTFLTTLNDLSIYIRRQVRGRGGGGGDDWQDVFVQDAKIVGTIRANNIVIYKIDKVLNPPSIFNMITLIPELSKFVDLVGEVESDVLFKLADNSQQFTAFIPNNDAPSWPKIEEQVERALTPERVKWFINQHLIKELVPLTLEDLLYRATEENLEPEQLTLPLISEAGQRIWLEIAGDPDVGLPEAVIINERARIQQADIKCRNGIFHIVGDFIDDFEPQVG
jgi:uncharacterized surface protein with fasciclin (FAS1) repeats